MRVRIRRSVQVALLTTNFVALGAGITGVAYADGGDNTTSGNYSVLGGNQAGIGVNVPIDITGNAIGILGSASGSSVDHGGSKAAGGHGGDNTTSGESSVGGGNQVGAGVNAPIDVSGNGVAALGRSTAATAKGSGGGHAGHSDEVGGLGNGGGNNTTSGDYSVLGGNQAGIGVNVPIDVCGNAIAVLGQASAACVTGGGGDAGPGYEEPADEMPLPGEGDDAPADEVPADVPAGDDGAADEFPADDAPADIPAGDDGAADDAPADEVPADVPAGDDGAADDGAADEFPADDAPADIPAGDDGAAGELPAEGEDDFAAAGDEAGGIDDLADDEGAVGAGGDNTTSGDYSVLSGNQLGIGVNVPIDICGNAIAVLGQASAACVESDSDEGGLGALGGGDNTTSGDYSVLGGNQLGLGINAPIDICGNAIAVLGQASAVCTKGAVSEEPGGPVDPEPTDEPVDPEPTDEPTDEPVDPIDPEPTDEPVDPEPTDEPVVPGDENPVVPDDDDDVVVPDEDLVVPDDEQQLPDEEPAVTTDQAAAADSALPYTGAKIGALLTMAVGLLAAGAASIVAGRRRWFRSH